MASAASTNVADMIRKTVGIPAAFAANTYPVIPAFGGIRFQAPVQVVFAPGETNRAFVAEQVLPVESDPASFDDHENIRLDLLDQLRGVVRALE